MPLSNYPGGFNNGLTVRGMPVLTNYAGNIFWVDSGTGSDQNPGTFQRPFKTLDYAIGRCTASNGDQIHLFPGHAETLTASNLVAFDVAGVTVVGHGYGSNMPKFTLTSASDPIAVSAADVRLINLHIVAGVASTADLITVTAVDGFSMYDCLVEDSSSTLEYLDAVSFADGASGIRLYGNKFIGRSTDNNAMLQFDGSADDVEIVGNEFIGTAVQTSTVALINVTTNLTAAVIKSNDLVSQSATITGALVACGGAANTGMFADNRGGVLDDDAAVTELPWNVTGMAMAGWNTVSTAVDEQGCVIPRAGVAYFATTS